MSVTPERRVCWAEALGECGGKLTREHLFSKGLFDTGTITVQGGPWSRGTTRILGSKALTAKVLCKRHNNQFSPVDSEGAHAFRGVRDLDNALARGKTSSHRFEIDGLLLERWFAKTATNLFVAAGADRRWNDGAPRRQPSREHVRRVFGAEAFKYPRGLYNWAGATVGDKVGIAGQIGFTPLYLADGFVGAHFVLQGLQFLIWFAPEPLPWIHLRENFYRHFGGELHDGGLTGEVVVHWPHSAAIVGASRGIEVRATP